MIILGIETSCDDSSVAVVRGNGEVLANVVASQVDIHAKTGGVVPEVAAREHLINILPVLSEALHISKVTWDDLDAIAVTKGPGLVSSLIIGTQLASVISYVKKIPLVPVQHIKGHIYSNWLDRQDEEIEFPVLVLTVSGGHNELILMNNHNDFKVLGETLDDAAGEAYDKVARLLGFEYPGGPKISKSAESGNENAYNFPRSWMGKDNLNFSFSGLKTSVLTEFKSYVKKYKIEDHNDLPEQFKSDISASFQNAVNDALSRKLLKAFEQNPSVKEIHLAGGVSANSDLREKIQRLIPQGIKFRHPLSIKYCTDNAAMIAIAGAFLYKNNTENFKKETNIIPQTSFSLNS